MHPKETRQYRMSVVNEDIFLCARAISRCEIRPACAAIAFGNTRRMKRCSYTGSRCVLSDAPGEPI